jgi:hypothetical protein
LWLCVAVPVREMERSRQGREGGRVLSLFSEWRHVIGGESR